MKIEAKYYDNGQACGSRVYPWCGIHPRYGHIVLFHGRNSGVMLRAPTYVHDLHSCAKEPIGHYAPCWQEENFVAWTGKIELMFTGA